MVLIILGTDGLGANLNHLNGRVLPRAQPENYSSPVHQILTVSPSTLQSTPQGEKDLKSTAPGQSLHAGPLKNMHKEFCH